MPIDLRILAILPRGAAMNFSSKKRPRKDAWRDLQRELDERDQVEEKNAAAFAKTEALKSRTAQEEELDPEKLHAYMDIVIGRDQGKNPSLTRGRLIFELFEDIMPRTVDTFVRMLESKNEPRYTGSVFSKIMPGSLCEAGDRTSKVEGSMVGKETVYARVEQEAQWSVPHLNPGVLSLADNKTSKFIITLRKSEELDGWHAVFGKTVYGFDVLRAISAQGCENGEPKLPVVCEGGGAVPRGTHPRDFLKAMQLPDDDESKGYRKKVMRYESTYRHTGLIGN